MHRVLTTTTNPILNPSSKPNPNVAHLLSRKHKVQLTWLSDAVSCCPASLECSPLGCPMPSPAVLQAWNAAHLGCPMPSPAVMQAWNAAHLAVPQASVVRCAQVALTCWSTCVFSLGPFRVLSRWLVAGRSSDMAESID